MGCWMEPESDGVSGVEGAAAGGDPGGDVATGGGVLLIAGL